MASTLPLTIKPSILPANTANSVRMLEANFGGGYRQRAGDGINPIEKTLNLKWIGSNSDIDTLEAHFVERAGYQSFTIADTNIAGSTSYKWTCKEWTRGHESTTVSNLTATLRKEYDLV